MSGKQYSTQDITNGVSNSIKHTARALFRGITHKRRLDGIDAKIVISGTRGKSSLTKWTHDILYDREYDVMAKITGNNPITVHNTVKKPILRGSRVRLYENARELSQHTPKDVMILENQAISPYTTRMFNSVFSHPDVVVLSNIREDHLSTLGADRYKVARGLVRAIPEGTHVVNAEQDPNLQEYIETEVERRGATVSHVSVPDKYANIPGIESVYALNEILRAIGLNPLSDDKLAVYRKKMSVEWTRLSNGRIHNAAEVNDVQSTEMIRQALVSKDPSIGKITPFVYLRGDRRGRTVSFLHYLTELYEDGAIDDVHIAGETTKAFSQKADFPVIIHDDTKDPADEVLGSLLAEERPVIIMGNTVADWMRDLERAIDARTVDTDQLVGLTRGEKSEQQPVVTR
ncbi:Mur ligase family protein [Natrialba taiwanensis]|uniref:Mur ligase middle domain-containing protein n=1 Tax=Natrialba taiwanensis DSM 12281 TaxID=1230458 RepID=M0A1N7_9EURY|nr:Mur ligase family protein [Natrialba taiwanensis]ELY92241.1 Mur ligase middle domain-containing protein [Natrialba taiwanensis DSM 12281]